MSNRLKPVEVNTIRMLWERGWSRRRIAREMGLDRGTVRKYVRSWQVISTDPSGCCDPKPATEQMELAVKPANEHFASAEQIPAGPKPASEQFGTPGLTYSDSWQAQNLFDLARRDQWARGSAEKAACTDDALLMAVANLLSAALAVRK